MQGLRLISKQNFNRLKHQHFWAAYQTSAQMANSPATLTLKTKLTPGLFTPLFPIDWMHLCGVLWNYKFFGAQSQFL